MNRLLLHSSTAQALAAMAIDLPHALLLSGPQGSGKTYTIEQWLQTALQARPAQIQIIRPDEKNGISVAQIRDLYRATRDKMDQAQYYILPHAGTMSPGAQNAFLKLLEEPNKHIHFILTVSSLQEVLPTIQSRTQHLQITSIADAPLQQFLQQNFTLEPARLAQIMFIAAGRPGIACQLASDDQLFEEQRRLAALAKIFISGSTFEKLTAALQLGNDRQKAIELIELSALMVRRLLRSGKAADQARIVTQLSLLHETLERLTMNANVKLQLTRSAMQA